MNILMIIRNTAYSNPGGDSTQIMKTAQYLEKLGVQVDIKLAKEVKDLSGYDIIHFFNIIRPNDILSLLPSNPAAILFISTIFVDYTEYERNKRKGLIRFFFRLLSLGQIEYLKALARWIKNGEKITSMYYLFRGHKKSVLRLAQKADMLLPNSESEASRFFSYVGKKFPYTKIVNAVEPAVFNQDVVANEAFRDHVLCVGRIEGLKNQLNLIKALKDTDLKLTIIGRPSANHIEYYNECRQLALHSNNIFFIEFMNHQELAGIYKAAKVHALPSWFETTGLSSLEAGIMGCNLVVSSKGDTREYFGDMAYYCDPGDIASIRKAVTEAFHKPSDSRLKDVILNNYTWEIAAKQTLDAYKTKIRQGQITR